VLLGDVFDMGNLSFQNLGLGAAKANKQTKSSQIIRQTFRVRVTLLDVSLSDMGGNTISTSMQGLVSSCTIVGAKEIIRICMFCVHPRKTRGNSTRGTYLDPWNLARMARF
jgi:hypothetical protein